MTTSNRANQTVDRKQVLHLLHAGDLSLEGVLPWSSNYTFLGTVSNSDHRALVVYKPEEGERPLWDFPYGTLAKREVAAWCVSDALGWNLVPPTVYRDGPHGPGMVQLFIQHDPEEHYFTFRDKTMPEIRYVAAFDVLINNADRKAGHCFRDPAGKIWCIDHGICFHHEHKLRTVIWDFAGEPLPEAIVADLQAFQPKLAQGTPLVERLQKFLHTREIEALRRRLGRLMMAKRFPEPGPGRHVPWPMV